MSLPRRTLSERLTTLVVTVTAAALLPMLPVAPAAAKPWPGHPDRSIAAYVVRPGETATGLAVRYHAWTAELISLNRLGPKGALRQGQVLKIPIVLSAVRRERGQPKPVMKRHVPARPALHTVTPPGSGWLHADLSRDQVRRLVASTARRHGVPPRLALAIACCAGGRCCR